MTCCDCCPIIRHLKVVAAAGEVSLAVTVALTLVPVEHVAEEPVEVRQKPALVVAVLAVRRVCKN